MNYVHDPRTPSRAEQAKTSPSLGRGSAVTWSLITGLGIIGMAIAYWLIFVGKVTASWAVAATVPIASRSHHRAISTRKNVDDCKP